MGKKTDRPKLCISRLKYSINVSNNKCIITFIVVDSSSLSKRDMWWSTSAHWPTVLYRLYLSRWFSVGPFSSTFSGMVEQTFLVFFVCVCATMVRSLNCVYAIGSFLTERAVYFLINIVINSRKHRAKHRDHSNNKNYEIQSKRSERERNNESQAHIIIIARKRNSSDKCTWANKVVEIIIMIIDSTIERVRVSRWKSDRQRRFAAATTSTISRLLFLLHFSLSLSFVLLFLLLAFFVWLCCALHHNMPHFFHENINNSKKSSENKNILF